MKRRKPFQTGMSGIERTERRGTTLLIVIALLGLLTVLGFVFYSFSEQSLSNATHYTEAAKNAVSTPDDELAFAMRQIVVGPENSRQNSVLYTGYHSLIANLIGNDSRPNTGTGRVIGGSPASVGGVLDPTTNTAVGGLVFSRGVQNSDSFRIQNLPQPDAGYTYTDHNSVFLGMVGVGARQVGSGPPQYVPFIMPSFFRPYLFRPGAIRNPVTGAPATGHLPTANVSLTDITPPTGGADTSWYSSTNYSRLSFRPNPGHVYVDRQGRPIPDSSAGPARLTPRFLNANDPRDAAIISAMPGGSGGWPFQPTDVDGDGVVGELGIWTNPAGALATLSNYELDVDNDGDGIKDGIWLDLDYPVLEDSVTGVQYIPMFSTLILDQDALINLNVHGNLAGNINFRDPANGFGTPFQSQPPPVGSGGLVLPFNLGGDAATAPRTQFISKSNLGQSPAEVNPLWSMLRPLPGTPGAGFWDQHLAHFRPDLSTTPLDMYEAANMELFWLLMGRGQFSGTDLEDLYAGRWGDVDRLYQVLQALGPTADPFELLANLPQPGVYGNDDNNNALEGAFGYGRRAMAQPLDVTGGGSIMANNDPRAAQILNSGPNQFLRYFNYNLIDVTSPFGNADIGPSQEILKGADGTWSGGTFTSDDLVVDPRFNQNIGDIARRFDGSIITDSNGEPLRLGFVDSMETIFDAEETRRPFDEIFGVTDLPYLLMNSSEMMASGVSQRLGNLMPFTMGATSNTSADEVYRKRFTTLSWKLRKFVMRNPLGADNTPGTTDDLPRSWEFNADISLHDSNGDGIPDPNGRFEFPPRFGSTLPSPVNNAVVRVTPFAHGFRSIDADGNRNEDPFRPQLRRVLRLEPGDSQIGIGQQPISINHLLDVERLPNQKADLLRGILEYRPLTTHPVGSDVDSAGNIASATTSIPGAVPLPPFPPNNFGQQEFWARRDRQKLARDIYVLLYTMGGGEDGTFANNYATRSLTVNVESGTYSFDAPGGPAADTIPNYSPAQLREMAQFAVNLVDALDRDNVITKFEYDMNLGTTYVVDNGPMLEQVYAGWNLDDDPYTANDLTLRGPLDAKKRAMPAFDLNDYERGVVYGVEAQEMTFGEAQGILSILTSTNHDATLFDDSQGNRLYFSYELQNLRPYDIDLARGESVSATSGIYRVRSIIDADPNDPGSETSEVTTTFIANGSGSFQQLTGNGQFTVAGRDENYGDASISSDFLVNHDLDSTPTYARISPASNNELTPAGDPTVPDRLSDHIDLIYTNHEQWYDHDGATNVFDGITDFSNLHTVANGPGLTLILERRANTELPLLPALANDWVEIDRIETRFKPFELDTAMTATDVQSQLARIPSVTRGEALNRTTETDSGPNGAGLISQHQFNTIGSFNGTYTLRQDHFDRDFGSVIDLFNLPLFGPESTTTLFSDTILPPANFTAPAQEGQSERAENFAPTAAWRGLSDNTGATPQANEMRNRTPGYGQVAGAAARFLMPDYPDADLTATAVAGVLTPADYDNRWFRILPLLEVPTRVHRQLGNNLEVQRVPGQVNLNTVRNASVLAGLIDEPRLADLTVPMTPAVPPFDLPVTAAPNVPRSGAPGSALTDPSTASRTDWFQQFLRSRDGIFEMTPLPVGSPQNTLWLPGLQDNPATANGITERSEAALPFQTNDPLAVDADSAGGSRRGTNAVMQHTQLRTLPADEVPATAPRSEETRRRLFEVGSLADHDGVTFNSTGTGTGVGGSSTPMLRHKLLAKIANNTSQQSNVFAVFLTVGYFEVDVDGTNGAVRVGGEYDLDQDATTPLNDNYKRALFIVDRSELFEAYDEGSGQFDWRRLVKHRVDIQ